MRISDFIDRYPKDGRPVTEPTVAYLGYTREYFFAAFVCKDKTPRLIRAHMLARDSLGDDDFVEVMLDTFDDQRRAFMFDSNALGIQGDGLYSEQNAADFSFDTVWDTWAKRTPFGIAGHPPPTRSALEDAPEERERVYEQKWGTGGNISFLYAYDDLLVNKDSNETASEFVRNKIRSIVRDPKVAELLLPNDHPIGTKQPHMGRPEEGRGTERRAWPGASVLTHCGSGTEAR